MFLLGDVKTIDKQNNKIITKKQEIFNYDYLFSLTGARHSYFGNDDFLHVCRWLKTIKDALKIRENILLSFEKAERESDFKNVKSF